MLPSDTPSTSRILELRDQRHDACVTIVAESSPLPQDHDRLRIALRDQIDEAERALDALDLGHGRARAAAEGLRAVLDDTEFWDQQSRGLVILSSPDGTEAFRVATEVSPRVHVGERFDVGALLRAASSEHRAFIVEVTGGGARLVELGADGRLVEHELHLPADHRLMLTRTTTEGSAERQRAQGSTGERIERERYCRAIQDEVVKEVPDAVPLVLAAATELEPAYRAVNTHPNLLEPGIGQPADADALRTAAQEVLRERERRLLGEWRELFGTRRGAGLATTRLEEVAVAASAAAVEELRFDADATQTGRIDEFGRIRRAEPGTPGAQLLVDEIVARVLRTDGTVRAVSSAELLDGSPVAAMLRFPVAMPDGEFSDRISGDLPEVADENDRAEAGEA